MSASPKLSRSWLHVSLKFLPFADAATDTLPLSRLLRLSLFQVSVGMALAMLVGTLNRVMIVELKVPAALVAIMIALPLLFAPFRALIGFRSDHHRSALGWRRVPYIWMGTLLQFGGFAIMPFALLVFGRMGQAAHAPDCAGHLGAGMAFLLVGAGIHTTQTAGLALATDLSPPESRPKVVGLMYFMLLVGMILSSLIFGYLLHDFSPGALIRSIQGAAVLTLVLNITALWKQEARTKRLANAHEADVDFVAALKLFTQGEQALRRLLAVGLGTMAFSMGDVLLEPFGGEILHLPVSHTTLLTALLAFGGLTGFAWASHVLGRRGADPFRMACGGVLVGVPAFTAVLMSAPQASLLLFALGSLFIGFGAGLFGHGTLTATMNHAPPGQAGLAMGAWGAVQATAAGLAMALGGIIRDLMALVVDSGTAYAFVYSLEVVLLLITLYAMYPLITKKVR